MYGHAGVNFVTLKRERLSMLTSICAFNHGFLSRLSLTVLTFRPTSAVGIYCEFLFIFVARRISARHPAGLFLSSYFLRGY